jgi:ABC-type transporter MlaC component
MARVLAMGSRDYTIAKYEIGEATVDKNKDVIVNSKVYLVTGQTYSVGWHLVWRNGRYKVRDIRVIFWLIPQQKSEFVSFLNKYDGDINRLIVALLG